VAGERVGKRLGTHQGSIWVLGWGRDRAGVGVPRRGRAAPAWSSTAARPLLGGAREQDGEKQQVQERWRAL
jgi:hypothetical protein